MNTTLRTLEVRNPATGEVVGTVDYGDATTARAAADAAAAAFRAWSSRPARERADLLQAASGLLLSRAEGIGRVLAQESGKRRSEAVGEVRFAAEYLRWFAEEARRPQGEVLAHEVRSRRQLTLTQSAGVAVCLTPWNFPVSIQARKLAPALAAGCTVVARPSEKAPLSVVELFRCLHDAGIPETVAALAHGPAAEVSRALISHPGVRVVSFTGSTEVGRQIMGWAAERVVRPLLELGGDAPFIVFDDADLGAAVEGAMLAKFRNNGQSCIAANRFLVQEGVYDEFVARLAARVDAMTIGDPLAEPEPDLGPLIDASRKQAVEAVVAEALAAGGRRATRERPTHVNGAPGGHSYTAPALLVDVPDRCRMACSEVFGPVAAVFRFRTEAEALERANATEMGLAAYAYTSSLERSWRVSEGLEAGIVGLNNALPSVAYAPMGGMKQSGLGREGSRLGLEEFCETKYVSLEMASGGRPA